MRLSPQKGAARAHRVSHRRPRRFQEAARRQRHQVFRLGDWAMTGWKQIFFYDPDGNVVEVHQAPKDAP
jgi:hypothetical protein